MSDPSPTYNLDNISSSYPAENADDVTHTLEELSQAVGNIEAPLVTATTVWPFTLYPDTITLDRTKLTVTRRKMMKAAEVQSIRVEDILNITANVSLFFGSISIATRFFTPDKPVTVNFFKRGDALRIKRIAQGYLIARQQNIDCTNLSNEELSKVLDELGHVPPEDRV
jgi:hypothetical protein